MLVFGAAVIINRNPIASALSLVVSFLGLAALFMSLDAFFIGIIQVLVYAGAVMVLVPLHHHAARFARGRAAHDQFRRFRRRLCRSRVVFFVQIYARHRTTAAGETTFPPLAYLNRVDDVHSVGLLLFGNYNLPFQIIGVLILVATIGVIVLSKRELR